MSRFELHLGDCLETLRTMPDNSVDSIVTDPPYGLSFMGRKWDYDVPSVEIWAECLRVLKPGGHLLAFAGTRTQHRMAVRIEDAGFEIRDMIAWVYGSGFPKSMDVSKAIDKMDAAEARRARQLRFTEWVRATGLTASEIDRITGTNMGGHYTTAASQPAVATSEHFEKLRPHFGGDVPEWVEQLVDERTVESENFKRRAVLAQGTAKLAQGRMNAETAGSGGFGYGAEYNITAPATEAARQWQGWGTALKPALEPITVARKPLVGTVAANVLQHGTGALNIDGCRVPSDESQSRPRGSFPHSDDAWGNGRPNEISQSHDAGRWPANLIHDGSEPADLLGEAARFFYCAKASRRDRDEGLEGFEVKAAKSYEGGRIVSADHPETAMGGESVRANIHPTVKPTELMRYLCRLVTPPGGIVLDPFMGSGSTGKAAMREGFRFIGCEMSPEYLKIARARIESAMKVL